MSDYEWVVSNAGRIWEMVGEHLLLSFVSVFIGLLISIPLGIACARWRRLYGVVLVVTSAAFAIPSVAMFILLMPFSGISRTTALIPLTIYVVAFLIRNVVAGIDATNPALRHAADAIGYGTVHRIFAVDLVTAAPFIWGALRVAMVSVISMVSVVSILGMPSIGDLFVDGMRRFYATPVIAGIVLTIVLAAVIDLLLVAAQRITTPWAKGS
jgi:osmoprotectant transport system permease protein